MTTSEFKTLVKKYEGKAVNLEDIEKFKKIFYEGLDGKYKINWKIYKYNKSNIEVGLKIIIDGEEYGGATICNYKEYLKMRIGHFKNKIKRIGRR